MPFITIISAFCFISDVIGFLELNAQLEDIVFCGGEVVTVEAEVVTSDFGLARGQTEWNPGTGSLVGPPINIDTEPPELNTFYTLPGTLTDNNGYTALCFLLCVGGQTTATVRMESTDGKSFEGSCDNDTMQRLNGCLINFPGSPEGETHTLTCTVYDPKLDITTFTLEKTIQQGLF